MFRRAALLLGLIVAACSTTPAFAQTIFSPRYVAVEDGVRDWLARDWDAHLNEWPMLERGRCVEWRYTAFAGEVGYYVVGLTLPAQVDTVGPLVVGFQCPQGPNRSALHTHLPVSCDRIPSGVTCAREGKYAYFCAPSDQDRAWLRETGYPFGLIQCDRHAVVFFFPEKR